MQQPFSSPGGSYGNSQYAAPPPKRGFSWLTCCLGCLGQAIVVAIILGVIVAAKVKKAAGPPITAATYRQEFPAGVPIYPGFTLDEAMTNGMRFGGGFVGLVPKSGLKLRMMAFKSTKGVNVIGPWYKAKLVPQGWKVTGTSTREEQSSWQFEKDDTSFIVSDNGKQQGFIMVMIGHGMSPNGDRRLRYHP
jgi:hypothetical protein